MVGDIDAARAKGEKILADLGTLSRLFYYLIEIDANTYHRKGIEVQS
jgi:hypothetical protein